MNEMIEQSKKQELEENKMADSHRAPFGRRAQVEEEEEDDGMDFDMFGGDFGGGGGVEGCAAECAPAGIYECEEEEEDMDFDLFDGGAPEPAACSAAAAPLAAAAPPATSAAPAARTAASEPRREPPGAAAAAPDAGGARDYTKVPKELDRRFEALDGDSALRPTIISPGDMWRKKAQKALLASPTASTLDSEDQKGERDAAFDLLDALTRSGALHVDCASLHVVVAATHCFDKSVTETVVQDNRSPIDKVERSTLIMASTVHQQPAAALIQGSQQARVRGASPMLFLEDDRGSPP